VELLVELVKDAQSSLGRGITAGKNERVKANVLSTIYIL
jgi:hypothetical protein